MKESNHIWQLMALCLSNEATEEQETELSFHLNNDPALLEQYTVLSAMWKPDEFPDNREQQKNTDPKLTRILQLTEFENVLNEEHTPLRKVIGADRFARISAAAAILVLLAVSFLLIFSGDSVFDTESVKTVAAEKGSRSRTILPDGSTVLLNSDSKISYNQNFGKTIREVFLEGEAFFDVARQKEVPFIVHTSGIDINVLGTAFNVKNYADDATIETTLIRGMVQIVNHDANQSAPVILRPHQKLIVNKLPGESPAMVKDTIASGKQEQDTDKPFPDKFRIVPIDSSIKEIERIETAWVYNRLEFKGLRFTELARKLERAYKVTIILEDDKVKNLSFNGSFENETVQEAFSALKAAVDFNYSIKNNVIYVSSLK